MATKKTAKKTAAPKAQEQDSGASNLAETLRSLKTKFGDEAIMTLDETTKVNVDSISTGSLGLDDALGVGGMPQGRIVEIYGPESSGKRPSPFMSLLKPRKRAASAHLLMLNTHLIRSTHATSA